MSRYAGLHSNKEALLAQLQSLADNFVFNSYQATNILIDGNKAAAQIESNMTAAKTGETFDATIAHFWEFKNDVPVKVTEYIDSALLTHHSD